VVRVVVDPRVVRGVQAIKFAVLNHWPDALRPELMPDIAPVEALVGGNCIQLIEISPQHLPADLGIVWIVHRAVNVEDSTAVTVHEERDFD
jgi:hypothetical protein